MQQKHKNNLSIVISSAALLIAGMTLYMAYLLPVRLTMALTHHTHVSNTYGGLPDLVVGYILSGSGAPSEALAVVQLRGDIARIDQHGKSTGEVVELVSHPLSKGLPTVLHGGEFVAGRALLTGRLNFGTSNVDRMSDWCTELRNSFPTKIKEVDEIENMLRNIFFGKQTRDISGVSKENPQEDSVKVRVQNLLKGASDDVLNRLLFFRAGLYELRIAAVYADGTEGERLRRRLTIDETTSNALLDNFNFNRYVDLAIPQMEQ